jgi:peptidoglycan hydrolase-like protein with peptidoglycan-binding domain
VKRTLLSLTMAAALLFPAATSRPVAADDAECVTGEIFAAIFTLGIIPAVTGDICRPFDAASQPCGITQVGASASNGGNGHSYDYVITDPCSTVHVQAGYDVTTKQGKETLDGNGRKFQVLWSCTSDPWIAPPNPVPTCTRVSASVSNSPDPNADTLTLNAATYPLSAAVISAISSQSLNGQLQNAIKQLQSSANTAPNGTIHTTGAAGDLMRAECPNGTHDPQLVFGWPRLDLCSSGRAVAALHFLLSEPGFTGGDVVYFSPRWVSAINQYDQAHGIPADGTVGPVEWQSLTATLQQGSQGNTVEAVQLLLRAGGETVAVDGNFGPQTDAAVQDYQANHGLVVDGVVGPQTWASLLSGS